MRLVKARELARSLGIPIRTMSYMCKTDPEIAIKRDGVYYVKLDKLAERPGFDLITAMLLPTQRWVRAIDVAKFAHRSRKTMNNWCRSRPRFAMRIGRIWYINLEELGASEEQIETLRKYVPNQRATIDFLSAASNMGQNQDKGVNNDEEAT
jgi:hypothetical protein